MPPRKNTEPMLVWPYTVGLTTTKEIAEYTPDPDWQAIRLSMKGISTGYKLRVLRAYRRSCQMRYGLPLARKYQVQIDNYVNALKRGGQLDMQGKVVK
jgi:hypothetical protein